MKMQNRVTSQSDGVIKEIFVIEGEEIAKGQKLIELAQDLNNFS